MAMKRLLIIIVNFRTPGLTVDCLKSLSGQMRDEYFVVVVDNASGDNSKDVISRAMEENGWNAWCSLHMTDRNGGFAWGNNQGLKVGPESEYILLLNSDTIVKPGCLDYCVKAMDADPSIGALSCQVLNADGSIQTVSRKMPNPVNLLVSATGLPWKLPMLFGWANIHAPGWDRHKAMDVGWIIGAFLMTRRNLVDRIGLLDDSFFFYGEDVEFCHRVWMAGHRVRFDPGAEIIHFGGASSGANVAPDLNGRKRLLGAKYVVQEKCNGKMAGLVVKLGDYFFTTIKYAFYRLFRRGDKKRINDLMTSRNLIREFF